jgi:hypothetical protein
VAAILVHVCPVCPWGGRSDRHPWGGLVCWWDVVTSTLGTVEAARKSLALWFDMSLVCCQRDSETCRCGPRELWHGSGLREVREFWLWLGICRGSVWQAGQNQNSRVHSRAQAQGWLRTGRVTHSGGTRWCQRESRGHHGELMRQLNACGSSLSDLFGQSLGKRGSLRWLAWLAPLVRGRHKMGRVPRVSLMGVRGHMQAIG